MKNKTTTHSLQMIPASPKRQQYAPIEDHPIDAPTVSTSAVVAAKFCNMGLVTSQKWFSSFVVLEDGVLKLFADEQSYRINPQSPILSISLSRNHCASPIKRKDYFPDATRHSTFFCFYVQIDNGVFFPTRQLKLGFLDEDKAKIFAHAINLVTKSF